MSTRCAVDDFLLALVSYGSRPSLTLARLTAPNQVLDAMDYAVYVHDVQHIILDNLQFMMSGVGGKVR